MAAEALPGQRNLTRNEAAVLKHLLGRRSGSEEDHIRASGLPRSTYLDIKQRLYSRQVLEDRYIPVPSVIGVPRISLLLARPFTEARVRAGEFLCRVPGAVLVWSGVQSQLAVIFHPSLAEAERFERVVGVGATLGQKSVHLLLRADEPTIPAFFDYEGAWNHFCGLEGASGYPRGLPLTAMVRGLGPTLVGRPREAIEQLLRRPFGIGVSERAPHRVGPATLARSQRRLLESGTVEWRTFLNLKNLPNFDDRNITDVVFVTGELQHPDALYLTFQELTGESGVYPFLLASGGERVLLGILASRSGPKLVTSGAARPRSAVFPVISRHLKAIEVVREPLAHLDVLRSHRYDLLIPPQQEA
jgi:hypothetical protein